MATPEVLDFATLLAPISDDKPAGDDLRSDTSPQSLWYAVKDARSAGRTAERQMIESEGEVTDTGRQHWRTVLDRGSKALSEKAKDLEVTAYMIEALVRLHSFAGLRDGFRLARELIERFWDNLYPLPDEDGLETRVAPLRGLNGEESEGTLIGPILQCPLTQGTNFGPYSARSYQQAVALSQVADPDAREKRIAQGAVSLDLFQKSVNETPAAFFQEIQEEINLCTQEFANLCAILEEKCGSLAPPSSNIRSALTSCQDIILSVARDKLVSLASGTVEEPAAPEQDGAPAARGQGPAVRLDGFRTREDAFQAILKIADFFRGAEPHSPVSYALEQVVRWGRMTLPDLLTELINTEEAKKAFFKQIGIRVPE